MEKLIPVISQIRQAVQPAGLELDFDLPQIAVVGGQSVGKSSLLEALVGRSFLPTGSGVVTRRPLILQLIHGSEEFGEFDHLPQRRFDDFDEIRREIAQETDRFCGPQKAVSSIPIVLRVTSPKLITLTLVDLPGIARVPVGDQPEDIEEQIRQLVFDHIAKPNCLILAVAAANADLATADSLALAREVDPKGQRTLGVLTKTDLAGAANEARQVLQGHVYPLALGFVGVMCKEGFEPEMEQQFFKEHPVYQVVSQHCTVQHLAKQLNRILLEKICEVLPGIRTQAQRMCQDVETELQGYGEALHRQTPGEKGALLLSLFAKFAGRFDDTVEGRAWESSTRAAGPGALEGTGQLLGRARIDYLFRDVFAKTIRNYDSFAGLSDDDIRTALRNATGPRAKLFIPEAAFEQLVRRQVAKLQAPSLQCAELVFDELQRVLFLSELPEFRRFVRLRDQIFAVVRDILRRCLEPTLAMIRDLVAIEMAYINTSHPDFVAGALIRGQALPKDWEEKIRLQETEQGEDNGAPSVTGEKLLWSSNLGTGILSALFRRQSSGGRLQPPGPELATTPTPPGSPVRAEPRQLHRSMGDGYNDTKLTPGGGPKLPPIPAIDPNAFAPSDRERVEVHIIKSLIDNYLSLVKKNIADSVPKAIMFFLVSGAGVSSDPGQVSSLKDAIQSECVTRLYKEELYDALLFEGDVESRRSSCRAKLEALRQVIQVTDQLRFHEVT